MSRVGNPRHPAGSDRPTVPSSRAIAWVDGRVMPAGDATVPLTDEGFLRGDAVFDAMLVRGGRTHARDAHLARLRRSGDALELAVPDLQPVINDLLAAWGSNDGILRLIVTRGGNVRGLLAASAAPPALSLATVELPWGSVLTGVKTLSYASNQWAMRQAWRQGADDALITTDSVIHELPTGAVCFVRDGHVSAPDHEQLRILDSITLAELREVTDVAPVVATVDDLASIDELFIVSAGRPVVPVDRVLVAGQELTYPAPGPVTASVRRAFDQHVAATLDG